MIRDASFLRRCCLSLAAPFLLLTLTPQAGLAFEPPPPGTSLCLSIGTAPFFADVTNGSAGNEIVVTNIREQVLADADADDFSVVRSEVNVQLLDRTGSQIWRSAPLILFSPDLATVISGGGFVPDTYFFPSITALSLNTIFFSGGFTCYGTAFAVEAGGQKYVATSTGFIAQTGDDEFTGADESRVNIWILNPDTGAVVHEHRLRPRAGRFLSTITLSGIGPIDGDADDELVVGWVEPRGNGSYKLRYETYNILTGVLEESFSVFSRDTRVFE